MRLFEFVVTVNMAEKVSAVVNLIVRDKLSSGHFPGVRALKMDASEHRVGSIFGRW